jgi:hypothetical protein
MLIDKVAGPARPDSELVLKFESLADTSQFGPVQRKVGV